MNNGKLALKEAPNGSASPGETRQFVDQLASIQRRIDTLHKSGFTTADDRLKLEEAIETLQITLEELRVSNEMLQLQNEELAAAQSALHDERQRFRAFFNHTPLALLVTDASGVIQDANRAATILLGAVEENLLGHSLDTFIPKDERSQFRGHLGRLPAVEKIEGLSLRLLRNPRVVRVKASVFVQRSGDHGAIMLQWLIHSVTLEPAAESPS